MSRWTDTAENDIIPCHYCVARYKKVLRVMDTLPRFYVIFTKRNNSCDFLFAFLYNKLLWKWSLLRGKFFPLRVETLLIREANKFMMKLPLLQAYQFPLRFKNCVHNQLLNHILSPTPKLTILPGH